MRCIVRFALVMLNFRTNDKTTTVCCLKREDNLVLRIYYKTEIVDAMLNIEQSVQQMKFNNQKSEKQAKLTFLFSSLRFWFWYNS